MKIETKRKKDEKKKYLKFFKQQITEKIKIKFTCNNDEYECLHTHVCDVMWCMWVCMDGNMFTYILRIQDTTPTTPTTTSA